MDTITQTPVQLNASQYNCCENVFYVCSFRYIHPHNITMYNGIHFNNTTDYRITKVKSTLLLQCQQNVPFNK